MEAMDMDLDVKPPQAADDPWLRLTETQRLKLSKAQRVEAQLADTLRLCGEVIAKMDAAAAQVRELRRLRAEGSLFDVDLAARVWLRKVERDWGTLSAIVRQCVAVRGFYVEMSHGTGCRGRGAASSSVDELAAALQRIYIDDLSN